MLNPEEESLHSKNMLLCPHCAVRIRENRMSRHLNERCPKLKAEEKIIGRVKYKIPNNQSRRVDIVHLRSTSPRVSYNKKPTPSTDSKDFPLTGDFSNFLENKCVFCGRSILPGQSICYGCS